MIPSQVQALLSKAIPARLPILVAGPPGVGKSDLVALAAADAKANLIISHPAVSDPTDVKGLPWPDADRKAAAFLPFGDLAKALAATAPTVWFLDDLGQATPAVQAGFMQLLLARAVGEHALPDCVTFVAATNRRTDRSGVTGILEAVKSRFAAIVELETDMGEWCNWAIDHGIPAELIAFIRLRPELLCAFNPSADLVNSPLPRTWARVAQLQHSGLNGVVEAAAIAGAVGPGASTEYLVFRRMARDLPDPDAILKDPDRAPMPDKPDVLYAIVTAIAARATADNFQQHGKYAKRLIKAMKGEFAVLLVRDSMRRCQAVTRTKTWVELATGDMGELLAAGGAA